jgi:O-antigen ligase
VSAVRHRTWPPPTAVASVAAAVLIGALLALKPVAGAALIGALLFAYVVMVDVSLGVALWIPALFVRPGVVTSLMGLGIAAAWLGSLVRLRPPLRQLLPGQRILVGSVALFLMWLALSVLWARDPHVGWDVLRTWMTACAAMIVVASTITTPGRVRLVLAAFVLGAVVSVGIGVAQHQAAGRFGGAEGNPNDLAAQLLPVIVLSLALIADRRRGFERALLGGAAAVLTIGLVATQSRGGALAAVAVVLAAIILYRRQLRRVLLALALVATVAGIWFAASPSAFHRVTSFGSGGTGRTTLWEVAWRIAADHAPVGVGLDNFRVVSQDYVRRPGMLRYVSQIESPHVVHDTYLQLLAETGVPGLGLFLTAVIAALAAAHRAARQFARAGRHDLAGLARAVLLATVGILAAQLFQSNGYDMFLWILLGLGPALLAVSVAPALDARRRVADIPAPSQS